MRWPWWRRREPSTLGNGHAAREALERARDDLREAMGRRPEVDRLARDVRRALGENR